MTKKLLKNLIMMEFLQKKKILAKLKSKIIYALMYLVMKKKVLPIYISNQKFEDSMDLLLLISNHKSHQVYIKDFNRFMFHKTKYKNKKWFCKSCLQCFSSENMLIKHKENCLSINGKQSVNQKKE